VLLATELGKLMDASLLTEALEAIEEAARDPPGALMGAEMARAGVDTGAEVLLASLEVIGSF